MKTPCKDCGSEEEYFNKHSQQWHCIDCNRKKPYVADAEILDKTHEI